MGKQDDFLDTVMGSDQPPRKQPPSNDVLSELRKQTGLLASIASEQSETNTRLRSVVAGIGILVVVALAIMFFGFKIAFR